MFKKILVFVLIIIVIILFIFSVINNKNIFRNIELKSIKYMRFGYSNGYAINSNIVYDIDIVDGKYIATIKPYEVADEDAKKVEIDETTINKILEVLNKYQVSKWDGYHKSDKYVLDGDSFSFNIRTNEDEYISASGYMMYPNNYGKVQEELDTIFMDLYNK